MSDCSTVDARAASDGWQRAEAELIRALAAFLYAPGPEHTRLAELLKLPNPPSPAEHSDLLLLQVHPYASVYLSENGMKGGEVRDRTDGFWRAVGREPPAESDHLGALLGLFAALHEAGSWVGADDGARGRLTGHAALALRREFLDEWLGVFLDVVDRAGSAPFYGAWSAMMRRVWSETTVDADGPEFRASTGDANSRQTVTVRHPDEHGLSTFIQDLLTPARSGLVVTRRELEREAREAGLAFRAGPRAGMLETLLKQAPGETLAWMVRTSGEWGALHDAAARDAWAARARASGLLAVELEASLNAVTNPR